ncbi:MAG: GNAT family N-acetyltransferase [Devosia sp.]
MADRLAFKPVTPALWADFEALFGGPGGPKACWCMVWRATPVEGRESKGPARKLQMQGRILAGATVGLLGYLDGEPVAWVSIAPRETYRKFGGPATTTGEVIWSLACMYLRRKLRGAGYGTELIEAAKTYARDHGATVLEATPVDPTSPSYHFMGLVPAFGRLGFEKIGTAGTRRHVMRLRLKD